MTIIGPSSRFNANKGGRGKTPETNPNAASSMQQLTHGKDVYSIHAVTDKVHGSVKKEERIIFGSANQLASQLLKKAPGKPPTVALPSRPITPPVK